MTKWFVALLLIAELVGICVLAAWQALYPTPTVPPALRAAMFCLLFGGAGGCVYCLRGVYLNAAVHDRWDNKWIIWYVIRPFVSSALGGVSFLFVKSGLLLLGASQDPDASQLGLWALAFLAGLNVDKFVLRLEGVGQAVWGIDPSRQSNGQSAQPHVAKSNNAAS